MSALATQKRDLFSALSAMSDVIATSKAAAVNGRGKAAGSPVPADPGGYTGPSSHPSVHADNGGQATSEGPTFSEKSKEIKDQIGAPSVDSTPDGAGIGKADTAQIDIGTNKSSTGNDPATEDNYKDKKDDPGTSHPARADLGEKYSSFTFEQLDERYASLSNDLLADLACGFGSSIGKQAANHPAPATNANQAADVNGLNAAIEKAAAAIAARHNGKLPDDVVAGYELASLLGLQQKAAQVAVASCLEETIHEAMYHADLVGNYLRAKAAYVQQQQAKRAEEADPEAGEAHTKPGDSDSGAGAAEGAGGAPAGGPPGGGSLGDMLGGGADPAGLAGGGDPSGGMGGGGGGASQEEALMQLVSALIELGVLNPEELAQAGPPPEAGPGPGGPGGGPPGLGGPGAGPGGPPPMSEGMKLASAAKAFQRSGKFRFKEAADGSRERQLRDYFKGVVINLMNHKG